MKRTASIVALALSLTSLPVAASARPLIEVTFVLDTTGSMGPLIEGAKRKIWSIATSILECSPDADIRMGFVAYRDIGDDYVTKVYPLTADIQDLYANLLELKARGGGDWPESVNEALETAVTKMPWTPGLDATRIMFLVGDAPPHMNYAQDTKYPQVIAMATARGIVVNAVQAGGARDTERVWREIAQMGRGEYIPIPQNGGHLVIIETPYDHDIIELQKRVNNTVIPYGSHTQRLMVEQKMSQIAAAPRSAGTDMAGYMNKRAAASPSPAQEAVTGSGDLVADVAAGRQRLDAVKERDLPEPMQKLSRDERQAVLDKQLAERKSLNETLAELVKKRDAYVEAERRKAPAKTADSFDRAVEATVQRQVRR